MSQAIRNFILLALMLAAACLALALRPTHRVADQGPKVELEKMLPHTFGEWRELPQTGAQIINPQQAEVIDKIYTQTISRSYADTQGRVVMLSIAYGSDQSDSVALHYPEVCYPAQGFQVLSNIKGTLDTGVGSIPVKRLMTMLGNRAEPVTYWTTIGDQVVQGRLNTKLAQLRYGFKGQIPDGLLFRVSSITQDVKAGHELHRAFVAQLVPALTPETRLKMVGKPGTTPTMQGIGQAGPGIRGNHY